MFFENFQKKNQRVLGELFLRGGWTGLRGCPREGYGGRGVKFLKIFENFRFFQKCLKSVKTCFKCRIMMIWVQFSIWKVFNLRRVGGSERLMKGESYAPPRATPSYHRVARRVTFTRHQECFRLKEHKILGGSPNFQHSIICFALIFKFSSFPQHFYRVLDWYLAGPGGRQGWGKWGRHLKKFKKKWFFQKCPKSAKTCFRHRIMMFWMYFSNWNAF